MEWWQAVVLGLVEGLTEYLPVSSTGHLILAQRLLGIGEGEAANAYVICIQIGAILAVLGLYQRRVRQMSRGLLFSCRLVRTDDPAGRGLAWSLVIAFLPAALVGLVLDDWIDGHLFGLWPIVAAWFVGGVAILAMVGRSGNRDGGRSGGQSGGRRAARLDLSDLTPRMAVAIGVVQCLAMWPGTSRSLVTILGGLGVGLSVGAAVEFSFLLGVLTLGAATAYKLLDAGPVMLEHYGLWGPLLGTLAAGVSAAAAVAWMVAYLRSHGLALFGYYRVALAGGVAVLLLSGILMIEQGPAPAAPVVEAGSPPGEDGGRGTPALARPAARTGRGGLSLTLGESR